MSIVHQSPTTSRHWAIEQFMSRTLVRRTVGPLGSNYRVA